MIFTGEMVREIRHRLGMRQMQFASEVLGFHGDNRNQSVSRIENGDEVDPRVAVAVENALYRYLRKSEAKAILDEMASRKKKTNKQ